jgi:hypothetical protein
MNDQEIKNAIVEKMLRKRVLGGKNQQIQTVVGYSVPTHAEGRAKNLIDDLVQAGVVDKYGGTRGTIRLTDAETAVEYLKDNGGNPPFPFD